MEFLEKSVIIMYNVIAEYIFQFILDSYITSHNNNYTKNQPDCEIRLFLLQ